MKILKLIGALIDYPADALWSHREELVAATTDPALAPHRREDRRAVPRSAGREVAGASRHVDR